MTDIIPGRAYVPARGQAIPMPGNQPDWPLEGQPVNPIDSYQARMVRDGDLVLKPETVAAEPVADPPVSDPPVDADKNDTPKRSK